MIVAVVIGGPYDGALVNITDAHCAHRMVLPPRRPTVAPPPDPPALERHWVEMRPVNTELGWRLYWPKGAS